MVSAARRPKLLALVGPTASGKSSLAMRVAKDFNGEIIAADSWTVYKGFNIGTSKPSLEEQQQIRHHLLDVAKAPDGFNAPKFKYLAQTAITDIQNRGKLPILVGGTGLYIDSVLYDFGFLPTLSQIQRVELDKSSLQELLEIAENSKIDLKDIDTRNKRRVIRAIEAGGQKPTKKALRQDAAIIGLKLEPAQLRERVSQRVEHMAGEGLEQEVKALAERYGWETEPMKGIGYKEWKDYFEGQQTLEHTKQRIVSATLGLVKRQRTWFKRNQDIKWFSESAQAYEAICRLLNN